MNTATGNESLWAQVAELRPRLRKGVEILAQDYRGARWYLLRDRGTGRFIRFNATAYEFLGRLDGDLSVQEILDLANSGQADEPVLEPQDVLQVLAQLHAAEVLRGALPLGARDLLNRYRQTQRHRRRALANPLALRLPLFDPTALLQRLATPARWIFSAAGMWLWMIVVGLGSVLALANAGEIGAALGARTLSASEVLTFWLMYPVVKALHELGHGMAVKAWGGEVHETGINLLVFMPVPYVDASAAWAFRDKRRRALVGAAGILVELFLAALAILVWLLVEPGLVRDLALNVALIGSVSTLLFNGNPLLRFDGYYVLEDLIEIPNLASRASRFYLYLIQRHLLGLEDARSPVTADGEAAWFTVYGVLAPLYRLGVLFGIALYLAGEFLVVGIILAAWAVLMQIGRPLFLSLRFLVTSPRLQAHRVRGFTVAGLVVAVCAALLTLPVPLVTRAQGVVWPGEQARVVSAAQGFVSEVLVASGDPVVAGEVLLRLDDGELRTRQAVLEARLAELRSEQAAQRLQSRVRAAMVADDIGAVESELRQVRERLAGLVIRSDADGRFFPLDPHLLQGKWVPQGEVVGHVVQPDAPMIRAIVDQNRIGLLREQVTAVEVKLAESLDRTLPAYVVREVPAGSEELPSTALGAAGGGDIAVDTRDERGRTATEKVFQIEIALPPGSDITGIGGRAYVRLEHGNEPLWQQWSRSLRQLLLSRLKA